MSNIKSVNEGAALVALRQEKLTGQMDRAIPRQLAGSLTSVRLAKVDEYGELHITERGEHHLRGLETLGVVRAPRSKFSRRR